VLFFVINRRRRRAVELRTSIKNTCEHLCSSSSSSEGNFRKISSVALGVARVSPARKPRAANARFSILRNNNHSQVNYPPPPPPPQSQLTCSLHCSLASRSILYFLLSFLLGAAAGAGQGNEISSGGGSGSSKRIDPPDD